MTTRSAKRFAKSLTFATLLAAVFASPGALAHTDDYLDTQKHANGGQMRMAGALHFELVVAKDNKAAKESPITIYVTDHADAKMPTAGAKGTVTLLSGKDKSTVTLTPDGDNRLKGSGKYASTPDLKAIVSISLAGKPAEQARFTPLAALPAAKVTAPAVNAHSEHKH